MLQTPQLQDLFKNSFDTYKAFDGLIADESGNELLKVKLPTTIWQIINHLIAWHSHQLQQLKDPSRRAEIDERETWTEEQHAGSQKELDKTIVVLHNLIDEIRKESRQLSAQDPHLLYKLTTLQQIAEHLSFHVGEVVLIRRMTGNYPLPDQMKKHLNSHIGHQAVLAGTN